MNALLLLIELPGESRMGRQRACIPIGVSQGKGTLELRLQLSRYIIKNLTEAQLESFLTVGCFPHHKINSSRVCRGPITKIL